MWAPNATVRSRLVRTGCRAVEFWRHIATSSPGERRTESNHHYTALDEDPQHRPFSISLSAIHLDGAREYGRTLAGRREHRGGSMAVARIGCPVFPAGGSEAIVKGRSRPQIYTQAAPGVRAEIMAEMTRARRRSVAPARWIRGEEDPCRPGPPVIDKRTTPGRLRNGPGCRRHRDLSARQGN